jgi:hypothetical protein
MGRALSLEVLSLASVSLNCHGLVANILRLVYGLGFRDRAAHRIISNDSTQVAALMNSRLNLFGQIRPAHSRQQTPRGRLLQLSDDEIQDQSSAGA